MGKYSCQQLHGGTGSAIYQDENAMCDHPECNPENDDRVMDEWMKEMERNIFEITNIKGNLVCKSSFPHVVYGVANSNKITLHGEFTIQQLEALINHMKKYNE